MISSTELNYVASRPKDIPFPGENYAMNALDMLKDIRTDNIYIVTGMKPYKKIKNYFEEKGGKQYE